MTDLVLILGDQLTPDISSLRGRDPARTVVLMAEVMGEATYVRHHRKKIVLVLAAMRRFAADLAAAGWRVDHVRLDAVENSGTLGGELERAVRRHGASAVFLTEPGEWRLKLESDGWAAGLGVPVTVLEDDRFLASHADFEAWAEGRKALRMEYFYRDMRRRTGLLMDGARPVGGQWNYDAENRKRLPTGARVPARWAPPLNVETQAVIDMVAARFPDHFGDLEGFGWATDADEAAGLLDHFIADVLPGFGDYQDAMKAGEPFLWHARLSAAINIGLLDPLEVCRRAEAAYRSGAVPLNAAEGFIRQILGWREFVRGVYWLAGPDYLKRNALAADRRLPDFYWTGDTDMACVRDVVQATRAHAYAHHIQRLMVTGNLALLLGVHPDAVNDWYMTVFIDAFEWVEAPNTHGMALFADGGLVASKPYAASGAYINRMSDYCRGCAYDVTARSGERACPFNRLYWDFLLRNRDRLQGNPRLAMPYRTLAGMADRHDEIAADAEAARIALGATPL